MLILMPLTDLCSPAASLILEYFLALNQPFCLFISKIGEEQSPEDAEDGPPELLVSPYPTSFISCIMFVSFQFKNHDFS